MAESITDSIVVIDRPPQGEVVISQDIIHESARALDVGYIAVGFADKIQRELDVDERNIAYVNMNKSGRINVEPEADGVIATAALAGCTGVAGFSKNQDGSILAFISHYDAWSQNFQLTLQGLPANNDMWAFQHSAKKAGTDQDTYIVVAYPDIAEKDPDYGRRRGNHKEWHYLDQIKATAGYLGGGTKVLMVPYVWPSEHTLASGRFEGREGIFWDGSPIDMEEIMNTQKHGKQDM